MKQYCTMLYNKLQKEIQDCKSKKNPCQKKVEDCFRVSFHYCTELSKNLASHHFNSDDEEICFFKKLKPNFTSQLEYYQLVYHSILFQPEGPAALVHFWEREYQRLEKFKTDSSAFLQCYHDDHHQLTPYYFLRKYCNANAVAITSVYDSNPSLTTNGDTLAATLLALQKYKDYAQKKLRDL